MEVTTQECAGGVDGPAVAAVATKLCGARSNGEVSVKLPPVPFRTRVWTSLCELSPRVASLMETMFRSSPSLTCSIAEAFTDRLPLAPTPTRLLAIEAIEPDNPSGGGGWLRSRLNGLAIDTLVPMSKLKSRSPGSWW